MNQKNKPARIVDLIIAISIGVFLIGIIFRIQHWPFVAEITYLNMVLLGVIILFIGLRHYQNSQRNYSNSIGLLIILLIISIQFNKLILFTKMRGLVGLLLLLSIVWILMNIISAIRKKALVQMTTGKIVVIAGLSCLIGEAILRSNHLPLGSILCISGLLLTMVGLIINYTRQKKRQP